MAQKPQGSGTAIQSISTPGIGKFYYGGNRHEPPRAIEFEERAVATASFLANLNQYFKIPAEFIFKETESATDNLGIRHRFLQQYYRGIALEGMGYRVHEKDGFVRSANGRAVGTIHLNTQIAISEQAAFQIAKNHLNTKDTTVSQGKMLIVSKGFTFASESFSVAFQFDIDVSLVERWRIAIDARNGEVISKISLVNTCFNEPKTAAPVPYTTGTGTTNYYGIQTVRTEQLDDGSSRLMGRSENGGLISTVDYSHGDPFLLAWGYEEPKYEFRSWDNKFNGGYFKPAVSVQWGAEQAYEYYFSKHNRRSFDDQNSAIRTFVHVGNSYNNAFWTGRVLGFGDGSNNNALVELDVVGHELTHGVVQYEAGLRYWQESGALNESFADIFGKAIEFETFGDTATWQLAKYYRPGGLRDFSNPNLKSQPDTYQGDLWFTGDEDAGGVHYNSGVQNFWFYLLCEGGSGVNDKQISYSINSIGMEAASKIAYRNLTEYLGYVSDYFDSRIGAMLATSDLYGKHSAIYQEVDKAWDAVGVTDEPIITTLEVYDITATTAKVRGSLLPRGNNVSYHFEYGTTPALGSSSATFQYTNSIDGIITGLQSNTKYFMRTVATNENGSSFYTSTPFTTISLDPLVAIKQTIDVEDTRALLHGQVNPNSLPTTFRFEYGLTSALGTATASQSLPDTSEFLNVSLPIENLQPRRTYYYRLVAINSSATVATESVSFFTSGKPAISSFAPSSGPIGTEVTIVGQNFSPNSAENLVNFGATRATVLSSSTTEIKVKVPSGASFGPISILDRESGRFAESVHEFVPTFTGVFDRGDLQLTVGISDLPVWNALVQDMDADGKPDIVTVHYQGFSVLQNVNQGGDLTQESFVRNTNSVLDLASVRDLFLADLDGNALKDIIVRTYTGLRIYPNFSVPGYVFFGVPVDLTFQNHYVGSPTFKDFDSDGHIDIAYTKTFSNDSSVVEIYRNQNPRGTLSADNFQRHLAKILPYYITRLDAGDVNNDGKPDLLASAYYRNFLSILKNNSTPGVIEFDEQLVQDPTRNQNYVRYLSHDLNQDSWKDIVGHSTSYAGNVSIMENKGTSPNVTFETPMVTLSETVEPFLEAGDMNGDGKVDLMVGTNKRKFIYLENKMTTDAPFSNSSFERLEEFGMELGNIGSGSTETQLVINDLNGDGRPDVVNTNGYNYAPHDGYFLEIWQNSPNECIDPSLITIEISNNIATIVLPPNTTIEDFEMEYSDINQQWWYSIQSTTLYVSPGYSYRFRVRAKCQLSYTGYYYIYFKTECADTDSFVINSVGIDNVSLNASNINSLEIQYSIAGNEQWSVLPQYTYWIYNLSPGTTYDVRFRGRCPDSEFKYKQFTTQCPKLTSIFVDQITSNQAVVGWTSAYPGEMVFEYSEDEILWTLIDKTYTMSSLTPGKQYRVRGSIACTDISSDFIYTAFTTRCPVVSALSVDNITPFSATVSWADNSQTGSYILTYSVIGSNSFKTLETNSTSINLTDLIAGSRYTVSIAPQCLGNEQFNSISFNTVCFAPFNLSTSVITHTTATLTWDDNFGGLPYYIDYSISESNIWTTTQATSTDVSLAQLRPGTEYEVRVHINCTNEVPPYVSVKFTTSLYEKTIVAPNPIADAVTIYPSKNLIGNRFSILDNTGRIIGNAVLIDYTLDLRNLNPGVYTLIIDGEKPVKIVKN